MKRLSLLKKSSSTFLLQTSAQALMLMAHLLLGRAAGPAGYGVFAYTLALVNLWCIPARMGQDTVVLRYVPIYVGGKKFGLLNGLLQWSNRTVLATSVSLVIVAIAIEYTRDLQPDVDSWAVVIGLAAIPVLALAQVRINALMGFGKPIAGQAPESLIRPLLLIGTAGYFLLSERVLSGLTIVCVYSLAALVSFYAGALSLRSTMKQYAAAPIQSDNSVWLRSGIWMLLASGAYQAFAQLDVVAVGYYLSREEAGVYSAASRISVLVQYGLIALQIVVAPRIAAAYAQGRKEELQSLLRAVAWLATAFALVVSLPMAIKPHLVLKVFGPGFVEGGPVLRILLFAHLTNAATGVTGFLLTMTGHQRQAATIIVVALIVDGIMLVLATPRYGVYGAAVTTAAVTGLTHVAMALFASHRLGLRSWVSIGSLRAYSNPERLAQ